MEGLDLMTVRVDGSEVRERIEGRTARSVRNKRESEQRAGYILAERIPPYLSKYGPAVLISNVPAINLSVAT